jgi:hypothetical protein
LIEEHMPVNFMCKNFNDSVHNNPVLARTKIMPALLKSYEDQAQFMARRRSESTGRPLGSKAVLHKTQQDPRPAKRGPKPKEKINALSQ